MSYRHRIPIGTSASFTLKSNTERSLSEQNALRFDPQCIALNHCMIIILKK